MSESTPSSVAQSACALADAQAALAQSEARYRALVNSFSDAAWGHGPVKGFEFGTAWWCELTGQTPEEGAGYGWADALHPEDRPMAERAWIHSQTTGEPYDVEYRVRTAQGDYRYFAVRGVATGEGPNRGWVGTFTDITARKQVEADLRESNERLLALSHRLLEVQEQERRFVATELHDEIGQILAGLHYQLDLASRDVHSPALDEARRLVADLTSRVREMSAQLRPTVLDDLGLAAAIDWLCTRMHAQNGLSVQFVGPQELGRCPATVETAAFRIAQEALTNVARHSGQSAASVQLSCEDGSIAICVRDSGRGFDLAAVNPHRHNGLSGMRERAELLGGTLTIETAPGAGACICANLPLAAAIAESTT